MNNAFKTCSFVSTKGFFNFLRGIRSAFCTATNFKCNLLQWFHVSVREYNDNLLYCSSIQHVPNHLYNAVYIRCNTRVTAYLQTPVTVELVNY